MRASTGRTLNGFAAKFETDDHDALGYLEHGRATEVIRRPTDDYTKLLLAAIPNPFATDGAAHASREEALHRR